MSEALFERCIGGDVRKVKNLLDTKELYIDVADYYGNTPLFYAAVSLFESFIKKFGSLYSMS